MKKKESSKAYIFNAILFFSSYLFATIAIASLGAYMAFGNTGFFVSFAASSSIWCNIKYNDRISKDDLLPNEVYLEKKKQPEFEESCTYRTKAIQKTPLKTKEYFQKES